MVTPDGVTSLKGAGAMPLYIYQAPSKGERRSEGQHLAHLELSFARFDWIDNLTKTLVVCRVIVITDDLLMLPIDL